MVNILILCMGVLCNAGASLLIKLALRPPYGPLNPMEPHTWLGNMPLWGGLGCFGLAFGFYVLALQRWPLHVANPIMTCGAVAVIAVVAALVFKEPIGPMALVGIGLILAGVVVLQISLR